MSICNFPILTLINCRSPTQDFFEIDEDENDEAIEQYQCGICARIFLSKLDFIEQHVNKFAKKLTCCKCNQVFAKPDNLYDHHEIHKENDSLDVLCEEPTVDEEQLVFVKEGQELVHVKQADGTNLVYILDQSDQSDFNELIINEDDMIQLQGGKKRKSNELVRLEHGYVLTDNGGKMNKIAITPGMKLNCTPSPRASRARKRHEVPDFSATDYIEMPPTPNSDLEFTHYKCKRCEQLFINKFGFFRHIEKGRCFVNGCDLCSSSFTSNTAFYKHYVGEHPDRAICNFCFKTFMYEKNVKEHMLRHLDQFRHRCEECNKGFYTVREYRNHYKNRHMGIRYKCEVCGRSFADEYYFRKHRAIHERSNASLVDSISLVEQGTVE